MREMKLHFRKWWPILIIIFFLKIRSYIRFYISNNSKIFFIIFLQYILEKLNKLKKLNCSILYIVYIVYIKNSKHFINEKYDSYDFCNNL